MTLNLTIPSHQHTDFSPRITVVGVGGGGTNAVNNMVAMGLDGVEFLVANTDAQSLVHSKADRRVQLGPHLTQGLGAGAKPEIGRAAAEEATEELARHLEGSHMVFVTAGMGGGTGHRRGAGHRAHGAGARHPDRRRRHQALRLRRPEAEEGGRCRHRGAAAVRRHADRHPEPEPVQAGQ
jgi:hypothetical protein